MSAAFDISNDEGPGGSREVPPQVFSRVFSVPAGAPWEQMRAAQLEVRHGSPVPIAELIWRLRRLEGWRPGQASRFAVFYVRSREYKAPFETLVEIDGEPIRVAFGLATDQFRRARRLGAVAAIAGTCAAVLIVGVFSALHARATAEDGLQGLDRSVEAKARLTRAVQRERAQGRELQAAVGRAGRLEDVLTDIAWASAAKTPEARIGAVHWDHGLLAVESRGEASPFVTSDRPVERSSRPLRPGVWIWGVKPRAAPLPASGFRP